ncbi:energy transducer TonB [Pasteurellaceae bacterium Pebbles2]|nr:energy transducer TonB [Pasteurellaceae bacterium Pebbles2]
MKKYSWLGFVGSLLLHVGVASAVIFAFENDDSANGQQAQVLDNHIAMQMLMATTMVETAPETPPEPTPAIEPEPEKKEIVADPTLKPKIEKVKPEKIVEKPKVEKVKPAKEKPKMAKIEKSAVKKTDALAKNAVKNEVKADKITAGTASVNSQATAVANKVTTTNPNLAGNGASASEISAYKTALRREIERHKRYPQRAKMMRKQGVVSIRFNLAADGKISGASVVNSSGAEDLDNAALLAVQSAKSIGARPTGMDAVLSVPVQFRIQ